MITLTTLGSRDYIFDPQPSALEEAADGVTLWIHSPIDPENTVAYMFTYQEACELVAQMAAILSPEADSSPGAQSTKDQED
jgi:hypothetical protein